MWDSRSTPGAKVTMAHALADTVRINAHQLRMVSVALAEVKVVAAGRTNRSIWARCRDVLRLRSA